METLQALLDRRSVRRYQRQPVPAAHLHQILEATRQAPSAMNRQPWRLVVVGDVEQKERLARACNGQMWLADAAYIIVGVGLPEQSAKWYRVDVSIALENLVIAARSLGYGTCWIGAFDPEQVKAACGIPAEAEVVACMPLGVPEAWPAARDRKPWGEVFASGSYGQPLALPEE